MEIIHTRKMRNQPLVWRKAALQETPSCWTWKDVVFYPIHSMLYKLSNNPSLLVDELIMGSNPLLNLLLLHKLSKECIKFEQYKKVGIFFIQQVDYWAYDVIQQKEFFNEIYKIYGIRASNIEELIQKTLDGISREHLDIYIINGDDLRINYHIKDGYTNGWIFHLFNKKEQNTNEPSEFIKVQNKIKEMIQAELLRLVYKDGVGKKVKWHKSSDENYPIIMSSNLNITSLPQGWIDITSEERDEVVYFNSSVTDFCYGSAKSIATIPETLRKHSLEQLNI